ncbi:hypothetical protein A9264_10020 [Vibrio sp. UCD-FRSSP16_10]|uniref:hypothetical protein n=1 Tax=unclassified Vibrio TaxID=2614977 RepID=UPI0007FFCB88|nr:MULTISPECIES: hypothetical protein [unclassified Vibrio]OBT16826.1 hypothetical protein A9260_10245 [Vibrio sp. UCD-FRSSP16_30]OBT21813.1 hypothetical protein A9264_10020 [Vibrio sp. UCD-FRSSP16_10]
MLSLTSTHRKSAGLSLLELLLSLALSSSLLIASSTLLINQQQLLSAQIKQAQLLIDGQYLLTYLRGEIRRSGYVQPIPLYIEPSKLAVGYQYDVGEYRRVLLWREGSQSKLKYCTDATVQLSALQETCSDNINYSMLNEKLLSIKAFDVSLLPMTQGLVQVDYAIAIKGDEPTYNTLLTYSRNSVDDLSVGELFVGGLSVNNLSGNNDEFQ